MSTSERALRLGTRGSDLALRQASGVREALAGRRREVELVEVETRGDQIRDELIHRLGKTGAFVRSIDERVLEGDLDGAIHSMKDMPTERPASLVVAGVPERGAPNDVLLTPDGAELSELPEGATVGTSSLRRGAQLLAERPDLTIEPLRGNVDTRVEKLLAPSLQREHADRLDAERDPDSGAEADDEGGEEGAMAGEGADAGEGENGTAARTNEDGDRGQHGDAGGDADSDERDGPSDDRTVQEWFDGLSEIERRALERDVDVRYDAIVLAEAGIQRSGLAHQLSFQRLDPTHFVPAAGQGALAVTAIDGTEAAEAIHDGVDDPRTRVETTVERTVLSELGGGCVAPIGVYAVIKGDVVRAVVRVLDRDGSEEVSATRDLPLERHAEAAREFAADLADQGAAELIDRAREDSAGETPDREDDE